MKQPWSISTREHSGDRESLLRRGNLYQIANGYMGYRGTLDEFGPEQGVGITLAGLFDQVGSAWREPVNAPNGAFTRLALDGVGLSALGRRVRRHRQTLHFADARFERETAFTSARQNADGAIGAVPERRTAESRTGAAHRHL